MIEPKPGDRTCRRAQGYRLGGTSFPEKAIPFSSLRPGRRGPRKPPYPPVWIGHRDRYLNREIHRKHQRPRRLLDRVDPTLVSPAAKSITREPVANSNR